MDYETFVGDLCSLLNTTPDSLCAVVLTAIGTTVIFALGRLLGWTVKKSASLTWAAISYPFRSHFGKLDVLVIEALTSEQARFTPSRDSQPARIDSGNVGAWLTYDGEYVPHVMVGSQEATDLLCAKAKRRVVSLILDKRNAHDAEVKEARLKRLEMWAANPQSPKADGHRTLDWTVETGHNPPVFWANQNSKPVV